MSIQAIIQYFTDNPKDWARMCDLKNKGVAEFSSFGKRTAVCLRDIHNEYGGWGWFSVVNSTISTTKTKQEEISPFNIFDWADRMRYSVLWNSTSVTLKKVGKEDKPAEATYQIKETIPIIPKANVAPIRIFHDARAALEIAAVKPGPSHDPIDMSKSTVASALLTVENQVDVIEMVKSVPTPHKVSIDSAKEVYPILLSQQTSAVSQAVHTKLVEDAVLLAESVKVEGFAEEKDQGFYEVKKKMIPRMAELTRPMVSAYLSASRAYRKEDGVGLSGISCGYAHGILMTKEMASVMEQIELLRTVRQIFPTRMLLVYGISHRAKMYAVNNVPGEVVYSAKTLITFNKFHRQVVFMPPESDNTITINFSLLPISISKGMLESDANAKAARVVQEYLLDEKYFRIHKSSYVYMPENHLLIPSKYYHNMMVYYTNIPYNQSLTPLILERDLLVRMYIANYVRNNWFHCADHFAYIVRYYEASDNTYPIQHVLNPPYSEEKAKAQEMSFASAMGSEVKIEDFKGIAEVSKKKKTFNSVSLSGPELVRKPKPEPAKPPEKKQLPEIVLAPVVHKNKKDDKGKEKDRKDEDDDSVDDEKEEEDYSAFVLPQSTGVFV